MRACVFTFCYFKDWGKTLALVKKKTAQFEKKKDDDEKTSFL
jgi:hypothetical protein